MGQYENNKIKLLEYQLKEEKEKNFKLQEELEIQQDIIERLSRQIGIDKILNHFNTAFTSLAICDLIVDPNPVDLKCGGDKAGQQFIYPIRVLDILAIESKGKYKEIHLRNDVIPKDGGESKSKLVFSQEGIDFEKLIFKIQRRGDHLIRIHKSWCINIYHYSFTDKNLFNLKDTFQTQTNKNIHNIPAGSIFDKELYHKRMFEIKKLKEEARKAQQMVEQGREIRQKLAEMGLLD